MLKDAEKREIRNIQDQYGYQKVQAMQFRNHGKNDRYKRYCSVQTKFE
jgi:hypothetical protein